MSDSTDIAVRDVHETAQTSEFVTYMILLVVWLIFHEKGKSGIRKKNKRKKKRQKKYEQRGDNAVH